MDTCVIYLGQYTTMDDLSSKTRSFTRFCIIVGTWVEESEGRLGYHIIVLRLDNALLQN